MSLKGKLEDFAFAEILQLLGNQKKTGALTLKGRRGAPAIKVFFRGGVVLRVDSPQRERSALLGERLVRQGLLEKAKLTASLKRHKKSKVRLGEVLVEQGLIERHRIQEVVNLQAREVLFGLFTWKEGDYYFESSLNAVDPVMTPTTSEALLMEGFRLMDEWPLVRARINDHNAVYEMIRAVDVDSPGPLRDHSILVASLIDGHRTVTRLIERSGLGEFETCKALSALLSHGYISPLKVSAFAKAPKSGPSLSPMAKLGLILKNLLLLCAAAGILWYAWALPRSWSVDALSERVKSEMNDPRVVYPQLRQALEIYRIAKGEYPESIGQLNALNLLGDEQTNMLGEDGLRYMSIGDDYELGYRESTR